MITKFYALLVVAVVLESSADMLFRKSGLSSNTPLFLFALAVYVIGGACWGLSLQYREVSKGIMVFAMLNIMVVTVAGVLLFDEQLTLTNKLGILAGLGSVALIEA
jgi:multidrug transporter EmrE-like cation transporter